MLNLIHRFMNWLTYRETIPLDQIISSRARVYRAIPLKRENSKKLI